MPPPVEASRRSESTRRRGSRPPEPNAATLNRVLPGGDIRSSEMQTQRPPRYVPTERGSIDGILTIQVSEWSLPPTYRTTYLKIPYRILALLQIMSNFLEVLPRKRHAPTLLSNPSPYMPTIRPPITIHNRRRIRISSPDPDTQPQFLNSSQPPRVRGLALRNHNVQDVGTRLFVCTSAIGFHRLRSRLVLDPVRDGNTHTLCIIPPPLSHRS
ncbi:hypothetical protein C8J57DRAFT_1493134 [Mycena rebaudengoi]|nr:hypothetical protein C8J57DRAFT_1493134 [Mycena rebaudengoi]